MPINGYQAQNCAKDGHEAVQAFRKSIGEETEAWSDLCVNALVGYITAVAAALDGASPEQMHELWMTEKKIAGWKYGPVKDGEKKEHPAMLPYEKLPVEQKAKDYIFISIVKASAKRMGVAL